MKKKKSKKKKSDTKIKKAGPWLNVLCIANNGIDEISFDSESCQVAQNLKRLPFFTY